MIRAFLSGENLDRFKGIELPDFEPLTLGYAVDLGDVVVEEKRQYAEWKQSLEDGDDDEDDAESGGGRNWNDLPLDY